MIVPDTLLKTDRVVSLSLPLTKVHTNHWPPNPTVPGMASMLYIFLPSFKHRQQVAKYIIKQTSLILETENENQPERPVFTEGCHVFICD